MLNLACNEFRSHFLPGAAHGHRSTCAACDSWAERIELAVAPGPDQAIPAELADRLRSIAREEDCRWVEETWRDLIDGLLPSHQIERLERHLQSCERCRETVACLQSFVEEAPQPVAHSLAERLRAIPFAERRRPPIWVRQTRYAAAASYLLVVLTYLTIGNPVAAAREKLVPIRENAVIVLDTGKSSLAEYSKTAYVTGTTRWTEYRLELWKDTRVWAEGISASWSLSDSDEEEKKGPKGDKENETP